MPLRLGPLTIPWPGRPSADPYWDFFLNTPPSDPRNSVPDMLRDAPEGNLFPVKADLHTPEITAAHLKELAAFLGADQMGIAKLPADASYGDEYTYAVVAIVQAEHDPKQSPGVGGQVPVQNGQYVTFVLSAYIRELGYRATVKVETDRERLAVAAGLGTRNTQGRLVTPKFGTKVHIADVILTDLPLAADA